MLKNVSRKRSIFFCDVFDILDFFDIFDFSLWGEEPGSGGPRNPGGGASQEPGGGASQEPGARTGPDKPPVALEYSKNPFRPSLIGE